MEKDFLIVLGLLLLTGCQSVSQFKSKNIEKRETPPEVSSVRPMASELNESDEPTILAKSGILASQVGYLVMDPETDEVLTEFNSHEPFIPSSVNKLIPAVAALKLLGPYYRFKTWLSYSGQIKGNVLNGNLYLKGGGDPFLTTPDLMNLVMSLKKLGVQKVNGHFYFDESLLTLRDRIDQARDSSAAYNSGVSALSCEFNQASISWKPVDDRSVLEASVLPSLPFLKLGVSEQAFEESDPLMYQEDSESLLDTRGAKVCEQWNFNKNTRKEGTRRLPVKHPGYFTAYLFMDLLKMNQIAVPEPEAGKARSDSKIVSEYSSLPLWELVGKGLEFSNNLMSELILLGTSRKLNHSKPTDLETSARLIGQWLKKRIPDCDWRGFEIENGSGLGSKNRLSPEQLAAILEYADEQLNKTDRSFLSFLPIAGWKGTLGGRMRHPEMAFRVWAKTGSQGFSNSLAGYFFPSSGRKLIFAILSTDYLGKTKMDQYPSAVPRDLQKAADQWAKSVRALQDSLLNQWIRRY